MTQHEIEVIYCPEDEQKKAGSAAKMRVPLHLIPATFSIERDCLEGSSLIKHSWFKELPAPLAAAWSFFKLVNLATALAFIHCCLSFLCCVQAHVIDPHSDLWPLGVPIYCLMASWLCWFSYFAINAIFTTVTKRGSLMRWPTRPLLWWVGVLVIALLNLDFVPIMLPLLVVSSSALCTKCNPRRYVVSSIIQAVLIQLPVLLVTCHLVVKCPSFAYVDIPEAPSSFLRCVQQFLPGYRTADDDDTSVNGPVTIKCPGPLQYHLNDYGYTSEESPFLKMFNIYLACTLAGTLIGRRVNRR